MDNKISVKLELLSVNGRTYLNFTNIFDGNHESVEVRLFKLKERTNPFH